MKSAALTALLLTGVGSATVAPALNFDQQVKKANIIVQATVTNVGTQERDGHKWNVYRLRVTETLAGNASALPQQEGSPSLWVLDGVQDAPSFKVNDQAVLLLYSGLLDSPVVGFNQGVYRIENNRVQGAATPDLAAFKASIVKARGGQ